ncbi:MAG: hypothetical protein ACYC2W_10070 [Desulfurivibrionaceae bacterium]
MKSIWIIAGIAGALVFTAITAYMIHFSGSSLSNNPSDWAEFGSYIGGSLGPPLSFLGLLGLLLTIRIQFSTLKHSREIFKQQQDYIVRKEKKEEWLVIIRDAEEQIRRYLALPVTKKGIKIGELSNLINEIYDRMQKAGNLKNKDYADEILKDLTDDVSTLTLNGLCRLLGGLATYLLRYRALLVEEEKDEIIGHYVSSYIHWFARLQWIGVMSERDGMCLKDLISTDSYKKVAPTTA